MSIDVFGRQLSRKLRSFAGPRGPPGTGFKHTIDKHYDMAGKRLCNVGDPVEDHDAISKIIWKKALIAVYENIDNLKVDLQKDINGVRDMDTQIHIKLDEIDRFIKRHESFNRENMRDDHVDIVNLQTEMKQNIELIHQLDSRLKTLEKYLQNHEK